MTEQEKRTLDIGYHDGAEIKLCEAAGFGLVDVVGEGPVPCVFIQILEGDARFAAVPFVEEADLSAFIDVAVSVREVHFGKREEGQT